MNIDTAKIPSIRMFFHKLSGQLNPFLTLAGIFLLGLILRLNCLDCYSLWYDEVASVETAQRGIDAIFAYRFGWLGNQTPLHYILVWLTAQVVDPAVDGTFVRLPSAIAGALTPLLVYGLGRELFGRAQGLLGALMVALSMTALEYSQDLRPYAMLTMLTCLSVYCLLVAARTQKVGWWLAFTLAAVTNMYNSHVAITMALPPIILMLLYLILQQWREKGQAHETILYASVSLLIIGLAGTPLLLDMLQVPRGFVNVGRLSVSMTLRYLLTLLNWYTRLDLGAQFANFASAALLVLAIFGAYLGRHSVKRGVAVCSLFVLEPLLIISLLSTSNVVTERYALFGLPFYVLLISHTLVWFCTLDGRHDRVIKLTPMILSIAIFTGGAFNYATIGEEDSIPLRIDLRAATRYLSKNAGPDDVIIFVSKPLDIPVSDFYWHGRPPSPVFDACDPKLAAHERKGSIYWVVSQMDPVSLRLLSSPEQQWSHVQPFRGVVVLNEQSPNTPMLQSLDRMVERNEAIRSDDRLTKLLRGCAYQLGGDIPQAVNAYRSAGTFLPLGDEYLRTAKGFSDVGESGKAWREALVSKFMQPHWPEVHEWMAQRLLEEGFPDQSQVQHRIAELLRGVR